MIMPNDLHGDYACICLQGVIGDWLSSTKQNANGKQRHSHRKSSQADLSPEADGDLHKSRGSSVGQVRKH
jgi:hypothetical protein